MEQIYCGLHSCCYCPSIEIWRLYNEPDRKKHAHYRARVSNHARFPPVSIIIEGMMGKVECWRLYSSLSQRNRLIHRFNITTCIVVLCKQKEVNHFELVTVRWVLFLNVFLAFVVFLNSKFVIKIDFLSHLRPPNRFN